MGHGASGGGQAEPQPRHEVTATFYQALVFPPQPMPGTAGLTTQASVQEQDRACRRHPWSEHL